jgi:hypothetical protein
MRNLMLALLFVGFLAVAPEVSIWPTEEMTVNP